ncbi:DNA mismatch repair protein MutT [Candidatus Epulonipiscioides gigas]|nr:DNA mismatch repair protein MutT [Epulopiscium sp. SCG-C07WGA-EpuloA2]
MKILELKSLVQTQYLNMYNIIYENKKGNKKSWMLSTRKNENELNEIFFNKKMDSADAVVVVAFHLATKSLVVIKQFRVPVNEYIYELPAGLIDENENIFTTTKRELKEETGLNMLNLLENITHDKLYLSPGMTDESVALVFCTCEGELSIDNLEPDEDITPYLVNKQTAQDILKNSIKMDIKFYIILTNFINGTYDKIFE